MSFSDLKTKARELLIGKRKDAAIMILVVVVIMGVLSSVLNSIFPPTVTPLGEFNGIEISQTSQHPAASFIIYALTVFLSLGTTSYYMKLARGEEPKLEEIFSKGNLFLKAFVSGLLGGLLICLGCIALIIPGIILILAYSMMNYIYIDKPDTGIVDVLKESRTMMKGHKWEFFLLGLSFIGWILLCIPTLGLLAFWLAPYIGVTNALFYDSIKGGTVESTPVKEEDPTPVEEEKTEE